MQDINMPRTVPLGSSRIAAEGCLGDAPHTLPTLPGSPAERKAPEAAAHLLLVLSFSHPIIIHHQSQETSALLSEKLL